MPQRRPKPGIRAIQHRLLIFCEGAKDKSENAYFKALIKDRRNPDNRIEVKVVDTKKNTARELVQEAYRYREYKDDELWVVFDKDGYTLHKEAFALAQRFNICIAFSSICFEYWILLHYESTTKAFLRCTQLIQYMESRHHIKYEKSDSMIYEKTKSMIEIAKANAQSCQDFQKGANPNQTPVYELNPYTNVDELVSAIEKFSQSK